MSSSAQRPHGQKRSINKPACTTCARRKVKCDREEPACGNCVKHQVECVYEELPPPQRHTKRRADAEVQARLNHLEQLLQQRGIEPENGDATKSARPTPPKLERPCVLYEPLVKSNQESVPRADSVTKHPLFPLDGPACLKFMRRRYHAASSPSLASNMPLFSAAGLPAMHPEPGQIFQLWQVFAERTNPMTKIIHAPSTQQRIIDNCWNMSQCSYSLHALLFAIYLLAIVSLSSDECLRRCGSDRNTLMARYGSATWLSLLAANVFETRELEVVQALLLFILSDPASDTATTLSAVAVRIGLKMGLDKEDNASNVSLFEQEMRVRLWWQICTHDVLARHLFSLKDGRRESMTTADLRLPLNVDDTELHPDMVKQPPEYSRASEMIYVLMKYEGSAWGQRQRSQRQSKNELTKFNFDELEEILQEKYLRHCDSSVPLHSAAQTMSRSSKAVMHYMRARIKSGAAVSDDSLLDHALQVLELDKSNRQLPFARQLVWHGGPIQLDAVFQVLTRLKQPMKGDHATRAWDLVADFWDEQIDGDWDGDDTLFATLVELTLEAWHQRCKQRFEFNGPQMVGNVTPSYIKRLQEIQRSRQSDHEAARGASPVEDLSNSVINTSTIPPPTLDMNNMEMPVDLYGFLNSELLYSYGYWNDFSLM